MLHLGAYRFEIVYDVFFVERCGIEIAINATLFAKGDVNVKQIC
jgi:hypothetical protein